MRKSSSQFTLAAIAVACILLLGACGSCPPVLRYITISPTSATTAVTGTVQFSASAYYSDGSITSATGLVLWSSSAPAVATVNSSGLVTGVSVGTATISASAGGTSGATATVTVDQLQSISVTPANQTVAVGATQQYDAMGTFLTPGGTTTTMDITTIATWASTNTNVTIGASTGLATVSTTATSGSTSTISATLYGVTGSTTLTVGAAAAVSLSVTPGTPTIAIGNALALVATENWSDGTTGHTPAGPVTWSSGTTTTASVVSSLTNGTGLVSGLAAGTSTITATEGSLTPGTSDLTVVTGSTHFAYVANSSDFTNSVSEYSVTAASTTAPLASIGEVSQTTPPGQVVLHPSGQFLYAIDTSGFIWVYDVNSSTGALTFTNQALVQLAGIGTDNPSYGTIDPYGRFLYVVNTITSTIYGFQISPKDGSLSNGTQVTTNVNSPQAAITDKTGSYLYVTNTGNNTVSGYAITQTSGALTPLSTPTFATGLAPLYAAFDPTGTYLFVANNGSSTVTGSISVFTLNPSNGSLGTGTATTITGSTNLFNVVVDPSGTHLYALDSGITPATGQIFGYALSSGTIGSAISGTPQPVADSPTGISIDRTGVLMAVDNTGSNNISILQVGSGGALTPDTPATIPAGNNPILLVFYNAP